MAPPPDVRSMASKVPEDVAKAIQKALAKKPADRFQSAQELYATIEAGYHGSAPAAASPAPKASDEPAIPQKPLLDELPPPAPLLDEPPRSSVSDDTITRPREQQLAAAAAPAEPAEAEEEEHLPPTRLIGPAPRRISGKFPRTTPAKGSPRNTPAQGQPQVAAPDVPDEETDFRRQQRAAERKHRMQTGLFVLVVVAVLGVLGWALSSVLWPNAQVNESAELVPVPKVAPAVPRPQPKPEPAPGPKKVVEPGAPLDNIAPPAVELAPPTLDLKPVDPLAPPAPTPAPAPKK
jgi:hypothetical protein